MGPRTGHVGAGLGAGHGAIGYGLCSSEDEDAHSHIFRCLEKEMERIVTERSAESAAQLLS